MKTIRVRNERSGAVLGQEVKLADGWWKRAIGLLGRGGLSQGSGMLLVPCTSVHTVGMRFPLDLAFIDVDGRILRTRAHLSPGRLAMGGKEAKAALELPAGTLAATDSREGDYLILEEERQ